MQLTILKTEPELVRVGYACPCGCQPSVAYTRGDDAIHEGCCCGNEFAVGPEAGRSVESRDGFRFERAEFVAPWHERLEAVWLVGPSVHGDAEEAGEHPHAHVMPSDQAATERSTGAIDPVCGMSIDPEAARAKALHSRYSDADYHFCGKGCKFDFDEDPERYPDPSYVPTM